MTARPVITGLGVVAPTGADTDSYWRATVAGVNGIRRISRFDPTRYPGRLAGEVHGVDPLDVLDRRLTVQTDFWTQLALIATREALTASALDVEAEDSFDIGVITSAASGGNAFGQREIQALWSQGPRHVGPYQSIAWFYAASTGQISIANRFRGACAVVSTESAGGLDVIAHARRSIRRGLPVQVCGGTEAPVSPYALTCQLQSGLLSTGEESAGYRPFTRSASGYVPGEGGAVVVLEEPAHAQAREAPVLAEVVGHAARFTPGQPPAAQDRVGWARTADTLAAAIGGALDDAGLAPTDVDAVFADGMGVAHADQAEVTALFAALGRHAERVPVTVPKAGVGRAYSGAGTLDVAAAVLALRDGLVPPTPGVSGTDVDFDIDLVTGTARPAPLRHVLLLARGFGGFASALLLAAPPPSPN